MSVDLLKGHLREVKSQENGENIYTFTASSSDPDRHKTVLNQENWKLDNFRLNPIIGYQHNVYGGDLCNAPDPDDVVGKARNIYVENGELIVDIEFDQENEKARKIESKVKRGFLNSVSVGFYEVGTAREGDEKRGEDPNLMYFEGQELLEISIVNIPSNPKAVKKSLRSQTFDALRYIYRELGGNYKLSEIEEMKVRDILTLLEKDNETTTKSVEQETEQIEGNTLNELGSTEETNLELERERDEDDVAIAK